MNVSLFRFTYEQFTLPTKKHLNLMNLAFCLEILKIFSYITQLTIGSNYATTYLLEEQRPLLSAKSVLRYLKFVFINKLSVFIIT
jgi:hypothetical protein